MVIRYWLSQANADSESKSRFRMLQVMTWMGMGGWDVGGAAGGAAFPTDLRLHDGPALERCPQYVSRGGGLVPPGSAQAATHEPGRPPREHLIHSESLHIPVVPLSFANICLFLLAKKSLLSHNLHLPLDPFETTISSYFQSSFNAHPSLASLLH